MTDTDSTLTAKPTAPRMSSFTIRMFAATLDMGIVMLVAEPITDFLVTRIFPEVDTTPFNALVTDGNAVSNPDVLLGTLWKITAQQHLLERLVVENLLQVLFIAAYMLPFWFRYSSTPGKMLFRLKIVDATTLESMTKLQAVRRFVGYIISTVPLTLGFVWCMFNKKQQGFHDLFAHTRVIVKPREKKAD